MIDSTLSLHSLFGSAEATIGRELKTSEMSGIALTHVEASPRFSPAASSGALEQPVALSLRALVTAHYPFIWRSLRRLGVPAAQVDDTAQEVFFVAHRRHADIQPGRERAFLFAVALRIASSARRELARSPEMADEVAISQAVEPAPQPDEAFEARRARAQLDEALDAMGYEQRAVFVLFEIEQLTAPEIASLLEIPLGTVASRLRRARKQFHIAAKRIRARACLDGEES
jgi:RNA polymerase sigma-70 factor, ECF subfamily